MEVTVTTVIQAPTSAVWNVISDIANSPNVISGIDSLEVLEPAKGPSIIGLKWKETRTMFGKAATETMWITDVDEGASYDTRAESHGAIYRSRLAVEDIGHATRLSMSFEGEPVTTGSKIMWALTGWMAKGAMRKALNKDLEDIRVSIESRQPE